MARAQRSISETNTKTTRLNGTYAHRFNGYARVAPNLSDPNGRSFHIVGTGHITFKKSDGAILGRQKSSIMAMTGAGPTFRHSAFELRGTHFVRSDDSGSMTVFFHRISDADTANETVAADPQMSDTFEFVAAERRRRLWLLSTRPTILPKNVMVDELVNAEAIKV